jgi:hypothetical protein
LLLALAFAPLAGAAGADAPPKGWKEVKGGYKKEAYAVWVPEVGKLDEAESSLVTKYGQVRVFRTVCETEAGPLLAAGQIRLPPKLTKAPLKVRQDFFRDSFLDELRARLVEEKKVKLGTLNGKEYLARTAGGMARMRLYGTGVMMFRVAVVGSKAQVESKEAELFFGSFRRLGGPKPKKAR